MRTTFDVIADLALCFPRTSLTQGNVAAYARMLEDLSVEELDAAAREIAKSDVKFFPSIGEIRREVMLLHLNPPTEEEAWAAAQALAARPPVVACPDCNRTGMVGDLKTRGPAEIPEGMTGVFAEALRKAAPHGVLVNAEKCERCGGTGEIRNPDPIEISWLVQGAVEHVGGVFAIRNSDKPEVLRAQFLKAYSHIIESEVIRMNDASLPKAALEKRFLRKELGS